jgi:hypothetical protein
MKKTNLETYLVFVTIVLAAVFLRLIPHTPNVAPIAALALFSGIKIPGWKGFILPLSAMILSDMFLGFHATIPYVYGSFLLIGLIGFLLRKNSSPLRVVLGSLSGSILFFVITNFGSWATTSMYEKNILGLIKCYEMGLPFFRNTVIGDLLYIGIFFFLFKVLNLVIVLMLPSDSRRINPPWAERHAGNTV